MKRIVWFCFFAFIISTLILTDSCKKKENTILLPTVTTSNVTNITTTAATCGGNVTSDGGDAVTARGVCYSLSTDPTLSNSITTEGTGIGTFTSNLTGLSFGIIYYVRAYATNSIGTAYGNQVSFIPSLALGDLYQGGIIVSLTGIAPNQHGLVVSSNDLTPATWGVNNYVATNAISELDGATNTAMIINVQGNTGSYAAKLCKDYSSGGYSDWFLPAREQLNAVCAQSAKIGNLSSNFYWSSTEMIGVPSYAYCCSISATSANRQKTEVLAVRAVRAF